MYIEGFLFSSNNNVTIVKYCLLPYLCECENCPQMSLYESKDDFSFNSLFCLSNSSWALRIMYSFLRLLSSRQFWSFSSPDAGPAEADPELTADPPDEFPEVEEPARLKCGIEFGGDISDREATEDDPVEEVGMTAG